MAEPPHTLLQGPALCLLGQAGPPPRGQPSAGGDLEGMCLHPLACPSAFWEERGDGFCGQEGPLLEQKATGCGPCSHVWSVVRGGPGDPVLEEGCGGEWLSH